MIHSNKSDEPIELDPNQLDDWGYHTVPAAASAAQIASYDGCQAGCALTGFDHQNDYNNETVRDVLLDAIVRLIEPVEVDA